MMAITPGTNNIQLNIEPGTSEGFYKFLIQGNDLGFYSKMTVKFVHENKLDEYLDDIEFNKITNHLFHPSIYNVLPLLYKKLDTIFDLVNSKDNI